MEQSAAVEELQQNGLDASYLHPLEVEEHHLKRATLLAVDQYFDLEDVSIDEDLRLPEELPLSVVPRDGLALSAVLRSASEDIGRSRPLGIALRSGELTQLTRGLPQAIREPLIAAQHDLEWVVSKQANAEMSAVRPLTQIQALAIALNEFPSHWSESAPRNTGSLWLGIGNISSSGLATRQIEQCRPPREVARTTAHGLSWLRWLVLRILPFPTFLISDIHVAAQIGVTPESLRAAMKYSDSSVAHSLRASVYTGPLHEMQRRRFWRSGVLQMLSSLSSDGDFSDPATNGDLIAQKDTHFTSHGIFDPVVTIDRNYFESDTIFSRSDCLRLAPDGWPPYADPAWGLKSAMEEDNLEDLLAPRAGFLRQ